MTDGPDGGERRMAALNLETLDDVPARCRACVRWEFDGRCTLGGPDDRRFEKEAWLLRLLLTWPSAGRVAYIGREVVGYALVAPTELSPRSSTLPTSPVSGDAALLVTAGVEGWTRGAGLGRMLVQGVAKDLTQQGFAALEVFGHRGADDTECMLPAAFAEAVGFTVVADHPMTPRLRLELGSALDWREDVEAALDRLLQTLSLSSG